MEIDGIESRIQVLTLDSDLTLQAEVHGNSEYYYTLLESSSDGDKEQLQQQRLKEVLKQLEQEREDTTFSRNCLFCRKHFTGNRSVLLNHLKEQHNFVIGAPDNIVFINELLDHLEKMLKELRCFFCEGVFKDWITLKEHMRKKQHKRINPENKNYDRFYIVNYLELGKNWKDVEEEEEGSQEDSEMEISELGEESYVCLFCQSRFNILDLIWGHMKKEHNFDFMYLKEIHRLTFYHQIKLINYIRKKTYNKECMGCEVRFNFREELHCHLMESGHSSVLPERPRWDQPSYFFSTFENDSLLCALDVGELDCQDCIVYPEENTPPAMQ